MMHYQLRTGVDTGARLGLVVGKKLVKHAVRRNLIKRLARECFRQKHAQLGRYDVVLRLISKPGYLDRCQIAQEVSMLLAKITLPSPVEKRKEAGC